MNEQRGCISYSYLENEVDDVRREQARREEKELLNE